MSLENCAGGCGVCTGKCKTYGGVQSQGYSSQYSIDEEENKYEMRYN